MKSHEEYQPSLEFLRGIVELAGKCNDKDSDKVQFELGPIDGLALEVSIEFHFKEG